MAAIWRGAGRTSCSARVERVRRSLRSGHGSDCWSTAFATLSPKATGMMRFAFGSSSLTTSAGAFAAARITWLLRVRHRRARHSGRSTAFGRFAQHLQGAHSSIFLALHIQKHSLY
jgi:hypothetical protein